MSNTSATAAAVDYEDELRERAAKIVKSQRTPPAPANQEVFELLEFCGWARISRTQTFKEIKAGRLIAHRVGDKSLITRPNALAWLNSLPTSRP